MRTELAADCATMNTAANPACLSLFPADAPARHLTPGAFAQQCRAPGVAATQTRTAAFRQLVLQAPPRSSPAPSVTAPKPPPATSPPAGGNLAPLPGHPRREPSAAQIRLGSTLVPDSLSGAPGTTVRKDVADEAANVIT